MPKYSCVKGIYLFISLLIHTCQSLIDQPPVLYSYSKCKAFRELSPYPPHDIYPTYCVKDSGWTLNPLNPKAVGHVSDVTPYYLTWRWCRIIKQLWATRVKSKDWAHFSRKWQKTVCHREALTCPLACVSYRLLDCIAPTDEPSGEPSPVQLRDHIHVLA